MKAVYTVDEIRRAEQPLLDAQRTTDELMRHAASAVADAARVLLAAERPRHMEGDGVLLLVGSGGNGGDALYAGASLLSDGVTVDAVLLGDNPHGPALEAFREAGGTVRGDDVADQVRDIHERYRLIVDGIVGLGGSGALREHAAWLIREASILRTPVLAVDVPSGVAADTGETFPGPEATMDADPHRPDDLEADLPGHVTADVTVTFGGMRRAHAVAAACGEVLVADIGPGPGEMLSSMLAKVALEDAAAGKSPRVLASRAVTPENGAGWPEWLRRVGPVYAPWSPAPTAEDDKYTGGVVGVCAGSPCYPGAGVLTSTGAVRATSSMVRYIGDLAPEVVRALPEVVAHDTVSSSERVQSWVVGPGRGTGDDAAAELGELLARPEALLIDADALTLLSERPELLTALRRRTGESLPTILTPHAGEYRRLAAAIDAGADPGAATLPDPAADPIGAADALATDIGCTVLLKGRHTVVAEPPSEDPSTRIIHVIDAGTSWAATPGSGDVLAGVIGAWMARSMAKGQRLERRHPRQRGRWNPMETVPAAVSIHARAAEIAARTPSGHAPTSASFIAEAIREATALVAQ